MKREAEFIGSFQQLEDFFSRSPCKDLPQIALSGRSNSGKSSLINHFFLQKNLARVSKTPGKTILLNFYHVKEKIFVDLPGYGYAKRSKEQLKEWSSTLESFFTKNRKLIAIIQLFDARHDLSEEDLLMQEFILSCGIPAIYLMTKTDKLTKQELILRKNALKSQLKSESEILPYSIFSGDARKALAKEIGKLKWD